MLKWIKISLMILFLGGVITLFVFIREKVQENTLVPPQITIHSEDGNAFITEDELLYRLKNNNLLFDGQKVGELNVFKTEKFLRNISQVKSVDVYQQLNGTWQIDIEIRKAIARIFNASGESFYLDSEGDIMHLTPSHTARVLVITGDIPDKKTSVSVNEIINNDSLISIKKLDDIYRISNYVCNDPLFHSLLGQIHLESNGDFVLIPMIGDQKIVFGSAFSKREVVEKFEKLRIFYDEAMLYEGWNSYSEISLKYRDQIVCKKKNNDE